MNKITSTFFQKNYQRLDEPVVVMARSRTLGTWYPKGTEPVGTDHDIRVVLSDLATANAEIKYLKSELAKRLTTKVEAGFGHSTPAPKGK